MVEPTTFLAVTNWAEYQHYRDRRPPWIKLHASLFESYKFSRLHDASKLQLVLIWMLASKLGNEIPDDAAWLKKTLQTDAEVDVEVLISSGFLTREVVASTALAKRVPDACLETETEREKTLVEKDGRMKRIYDLWRQERGKAHGRYATVSRSRREKISARLKDGFTEEELCLAITGIGRDPWPERGRHDDLTVIFRSREQVEKFIELAEASPNGSTACRNPTSDRTMIPPQRLIACGCHDCLEALEFVK